MKPTPPQVDAAVQAARRAFDAGPWPRMTLDARKDILYRIRDVIRAHTDELACLECLNTGLPIARIREQIGRASRNFEFFAEVASTMKGETYTGLKGYLTYVTREPKGVGALIAPWNSRRREVIIGVHETHTSEYVMISRGQSFTAGGEAASHGEA